MRRDPYLQESQRVAQLPQREDDLALLRAHLGDLAVNGLDRAARCILHVGVQLDACDLQGRDGALCARAVSSSAGADCTQGIHRHTQTRIVLLTMAVSVVKTLDEWMMLAVVKPCSANTETAPATSGSRSHSRQSIHPSIHPSTHPAPSLPPLPTFGVAVCGRHDSKQLVKALLVRGDPRRIASDQQHALRVGGCSGGLGE